MNVIAIDTHEVVKELRAVGFSEDQAEADLSALATKSDVEFLGKDIEALRKDTKGDIEALRKDTKGDIEALRKDTKGDIEVLREDMKGDVDGLRKDMEKGFEVLRREMADQKSDLLKWITGAIGFQTVATFGAVFALTHALKA